MGENSTSSDALKISDHPRRAMAAEYLTHKGVLFPGVDYSPETLSYLENEFQVRDDDVFNVTYPKSGTNWMLEILSLIRCEGDPGWVRSVLNWDRAPWIETQTGLEAALKYPSPRLLTSHLPVQLFPRSWQHSKAKVIYTLRCPKDVLVSLYHFSHFMQIFKVPSSMDSFLEDFLSGNVLYSSWFDHVTGWMGLKGNENFFFITYEELQQDPGGSVRRICRFLGKELSEEQVASVVENASFQSMKGNQMSNFSQIPDTYMDHEKGELLRKGKPRMGTTYQDSEILAELREGGCVLGLRVTGTGMEGGTRRAVTVG
uniref:Sulfotransferase n=1 Tax=Pelusios castaneus TaxID=367368 RepID=A0A8C8SVW7_9SAUR